MFNQSGQKVGGDQINIGNLNKEKLLEMIMDLKDSLYSFNLSTPYSEEDEQHNKSTQRDMYDLLERLERELRYG